jgi:hypothetical protein
VEGSHEPPIIGGRGRDVQRLSHARAEALLDLLTLTMSAGLKPCPTFLTSGGATVTASPACATSCVDTPVARRVR